MADAGRKFTAEDFESEIPNVEAEVTLLDVRTELLQAALRIAANVTRPLLIEHVIDPVLYADHELAVAIREKLING